MRILGIDPGKKNIGIALSDPTGTLATPINIIQHTSRDNDAASIVAIAKKNKVGLIIVGQALNQDGELTVSGRNARRLAAAIRQLTENPVILWDESYSTKRAQEIKKKKMSRNGHLDDVAAALILQSYLDSLQEEL